MKKYKKYIIKSILFGFLAFFIFIFNAKAYNEDLYDGLTLPPYNKIRYIGIGANDSYTERTLADHMDSDLITRFFWIDGLYNDANGFSFAWLNDFVFVPNNLYNIAVLYCTTSGTVINGYRQFAVGTGTSFTTATTNATYNENNNYILQKDYSNLGAYYTDSTDFHTCLLASMQFRANNAGNVVAVKYWNSNGRVSMGTLAYMGYILDNQGQDFNVFKDQILSNITSSQNAIINNQNSNRQLIINNQNSNTQQIISEQQNTTAAVEDLNDTMKDSSTDSPNSGINAVKNGIATNGVITQLITLPVTLFQQILTSINGTCQTFNLGSLFGTDLLLPCINVSNYLGATLWGIIDVIISGYFVWVISKKMISAFEMFSAMKDGDVLDD